MRLTLGLILTFLGLVVSLVTAILIILAIGNIFVELIAAFGISQGALTTGIALMLREKERIIRR